METDDQCLLGATWVDRVPSASVRMGRISAETGDGTDFTGVVWFLRAPGARDFRPAVRDCVDPDSRRPSHGAGAPAPDRPGDFYPASVRRMAPG